MCHNYLYMNRATKLHPPKRTSYKRGVEPLAVYLLSLILHPPEEMPCSEDWLT